GRFDDAEARALEACALAERINYPLEKGLPLAALTQLAVHRGDFDAAERQAHEALLIQRLTDYHWAAGLFLPAVMSAYVARGGVDEQFRRAASPRPRRCRRPARTRGRGDRNARARHEHRPVVERGAGARSCVS